MNIIGPVVSGAPRRIAEGCTESAVPARARYRARSTKAVPSQRVKGRLTANVALC